MKDPFKSRKEKVRKLIMAMPVRGRNIKLANVVGIHSTTISNIAHGFKPISVRTMLILENYFEQIK